MGVIIDSIGYVEYHKRLFKVLKIEYDSTLETADIRQDCCVRYMREYRKLQEYKRKKATLSATQVKQAVVEELRDNRKGYAYKTGVAAP